MKVAFGTDDGVFPHGENGREFAFMVEAGMPPIKAILSATVVNAGILGLADQVGTPEPCKLADIIATDENPLQNISTLEKVSFVMKEGIVYKEIHRVADVDRGEKSFGPTTSNIAGPGTQHRR